MLQQEISTNVRIPEDLWQEMKIFSVQNKKTMKQLIIEGLSLVLGRQSVSEVSRSVSAPSLLLEFSGRASADVEDGSLKHDRYIYG